MRQCKWSCPVLAILLLVLMGLGAGCQLWPASPSISERELLVINSAGHLNLTDLQGHQTDLSQKLGVLGTQFPTAWSPSGESVAFVCGLKEQSTLQICSVDITKMTLQTFPLSEDKVVNLLIWSVDEKSFLILEGREIWQLDIATGQLNLLSRLPDAMYISEGYESWSPDRSRIAFITSLPRTWKENPAWEHQDLYVQRVDGTSRQLIYKGVRGGVAWSPDGKMLAFDKGVICWIAVEGGEATCIPNSSGTPLWSPDGRFIAFGTGVGMDMMDTQTKEVRTLLRRSDKGTMMDLAWSPDGLYLAYTACPGMPPNDWCEIYVARSDGSQSWQLTRNRVLDEHPVWRPITPMITPAP
jgi:Tol biopolymer transport system component